ncbi:MAG: hypothetical protein ACI4KG_07750 [Oscillospiraceae bacterium]
MKKLGLNRFGAKENRLWLFSAALFALIVIWFAVSLENADSAADKKRADSVYDAVMNGAVLCYSIEGEYPPDLEYLEKNYGVKINREKYIVDYSYFGANVPPTVKVAEKEQNQ